MRALIAAGVALSLLACSGDPPLGPALQRTADRLAAEMVASEQLEPARQAMAEVVAAEVVREGGPFTIEVRSGESLALYARWLGIIPERIAELNQLDPYGTINVGQPVKLPVGTTSPARFETARKAWRDGQIAAWVKQRGGVHKVEVYKVKRGDTVLGIAKRNGRLPLWLMRHYNPDRSLDQLAVGDEIKVPIMGERVLSQR